MPETVRAEQAPRIDFQADPWAPQSTLRLTGIARTADASRPSPLLPSGASIATKGIPMKRSPRARLLVAAVIAAGSVAVTASPASAVPPAPVIQLVAAGDGQLHGMPRTLPAGRVTFSLTSRSPHGADLALLKLRNRYTLARLVRDYNVVAADTASDADKAAAIRRLEHGINAFATPAPSSGTMSATFTVYDGDYYWFNAAAPRLTVGAVHELTVYGAPVQRAFPSTDGVVTAVESGSTTRWSAPTSLPHAGRILFRNSTDELHFLYLQQVREGTTDRDIQRAAEAFQAGRTPASNPFLTIAEGTDLLTPGNQVVLTYDVPPGTYDIECFVPDDQTGMPHIVMGMHKIIKLT